jgi:hypothetical protein
LILLKRLKNELKGVTLLLEALEAPYRHLY